MLYAEVSASFPVFTDSELTLRLGRSSGDTVMSGLVKMTLIWTMA